MTFSIWLLLKLNAIYLKYLLNVVCHSCKLLVIPSYSALSAVKPAINPKPQIRPKPNTAAPAQSIPTKPSPAGSSGRTSRLYPAPKDTNTGQNALLTVELGQNKMA